MLDRLLARAYDPIMGRAERGALGALRREVLAPLSGHVVVVGAGTGADLRHLPAAVERVTLVEPSPAMRDRLLVAAHAADVHAEVVAGFAEALPLDRDAVDHVVAALVLCSVRDPRAAVEEFDRVLRPGGSVTVIEHGRSLHSTSARLAQTAFEPVWKRLAGGCHLTRDARDALSLHFDVSAITPVTVPPVSLVGTVIAGHATR